MVSQQFSHRRRVRSTASAVALLLTLAGTTLTGCRIGPVPEKLLPAKQLKGELLTAPLGSKPFARGTLAPGGILTLDQFVDGHFAVKDRADEKEIARQQGLARAAETNWNAPDGTQADVFLIQFGKSEGAADFVSGVSEATAADESPNRPLSAPAGIPGAEAWTAGAVNSVGNFRQTAWFAVGNVAVDLTYYTPGRPNPAGLSQLARAQYARLVGHVTTPSPQPVSTAVAPAPTSTAPATATAADKSRLLRDLTAAPKGSRPWAKSSTNGPTGILTLTQLLVRYADSTDRELVSNEELDRGFQFAVRKNWHASDGSQVDINLLQFSTATGAQSFTLAYQSSTGDDVGADGTFPVPGSGDAQAFQHPKLTVDGDIWTESYAVIGNVAIDVDFWMPAKADRKAATALFQKQYATLMADPTVAAAAAAAPALPTPAH
ncbi:hypothetical protein [Streptacidiphilus sp. PAMC 29251]